MSDYMSDFIKFKEEEKIIAKIHEHLKKEKIIPGDVKLTFFITDVTSYNYTRRLCLETFKMRTLSTINVNFFDLVVAAEMYQRPNYYSPVVAYLHEVGHLLDFLEDEESFWKREKQHRMLLKLIVENFEDRPLQKEFFYRLMPMEDKANTIKNEIYKKIEFMVPEKFKIREEEEN